MIIHSSRIYTEAGCKEGYLFIEDGKIVDIKESCTSSEVIDFHEQRIIPGIFDTHNHGTMGYGLTASDSQDKEAIVKGYLKGLAAQGVTNIFPTCHIDMIKTVSEVADHPQDGATIVGIHSEGPWLNRVGEKGIKTGWPEVSLETAKKMVADGGGKLKLVALAPEIPGIDEIIDYFTSEGVTLAFAHSDMTYEEARQAIAGRISVATHLGNVMTGLHHRDIGGLGACLQDPEMMYEIICDGMHISLPMIELYFKINDFSRYMMISDCSQMCGAPVGQYKGWNSSMILNMTEEGFVLSDTGRICGSSKPVLYGMANLVEKLHIPMETVVQMASLNPAKKYSLDSSKGSIAVGKDADFVVISDDYQAIATYANGRKVYDCEVDKDLFNPKFLEETKI